jgi:hypothetical protein
VPKFVVTEPGVFFFGYNRCTVPAAAGESVDDVVTAPLDFLKADVRVFCCEPIVPISRKLARLRWCK